MAVQTEDIPKIYVDGVDLDEYVVMEVELSKELLKPSSLRFVMRGKRLLRNENEINFAIASELLGSVVEMETTTQRRDEGMEMAGESLMFRGIIFGADARRDRMGQVLYIDVRAYSPDYLLVDNPHCASFEDLSLSDIVDEVVRPYRGRIEVDIDPRLQDRHKYVVQYNETSYQFISRLAQRYGEFLFYDNDRLYFGRTPEGDSKELYPDVDILGFRYQLNMEHTNFRHAQHDYLKYENKMEDGFNRADGDLHRFTDMVFDHSHSTYSKDTLQDIHSAVEEDSSFSQVESSATVEGCGAKARMMTCMLHTNRADINIGDRLIIKEYVDDSDAYIIEHQELIAVGINYRVNIDGHFENQVMAVPSSVVYPPYGIVDLYPVCESQRAIVVDNRDPERLGRIRVKFLWQEQQGGDMKSPWIRIAQPHGGDDKGFYFIPEIGEEVMVAFENGNGEKPYVVGTLYHGLQHPGNTWPGGSNDIKAIRTRNGHTVEIHDSGTGGYIRIYDYIKENYILTYSTDEKLIKLESKGNIELYAANDIIMQAGHDITTTAGRDISESAGNDFTLTAGNDMNRMADNDINEQAGNDRSTSIGRNDSIDVGENQFVRVGDNKDEHIEKKLQVMAENIRIEAEKQLMEYSETHHQKADKDMAVNAGQTLDIKAQTVKTN